MSDSNSAVPRDWSGLPTTGIPVILDGIPSSPKMYILGWLLAEPILPPGIV